MKRAAISGAIFLTAALTLPGCGSPALTDVAAGALPPAVRIAAQGRVEGRFETVAVGAAVDGVITDLLVAEGAHVRAGAVLARVGCDDVREERNVAVADHAVAEASLARVTRGGRDEDVRAAEAVLDAASARMAIAAKRLVRARELFEHEGVISAAEFDEAESAAASAAADLALARERLQASRLIPLPEDLRKAQSEVARAAMQIAVADRRLAKCQVVAPTSGRVVRVLLHPGERASAWNGPPVLQLANDSDTRVRVEVDEADAMSLRIGQKASVQIPKTTLRFAGEIAELAPHMGRRAIRSADPADRNDRDVREAVVRLFEAPPDPLPIGLRVVCVFEPR